MVSCCHLLVFLATLVMGISAQSQIREWSFTLNTDKRLSHAFWRVETLGSKISSFNHRSIQVDGKPVKINDSIGQVYDLLRVPFYSNIWSIKISSNHCYEHCLLLGCVVDIGLVIDMSGSIMDVDPEANNWGTQMDFVKSMITALNVGIDMTRIAVVTFGNRAKLHFTLDQYKWV